MDGHAVVEQGGDRGHAQAISGCRCAALGMPACVSTCLQWHLLWWGLEGNPVQGTILVVLVAGR